MDTSPWWREGVIYQIYPRSYYDTTCNGIGDLPGIIEKLDYIADLGVDAIWLSPIYPSPDADFGYDVSDYQDIDPRFGTMADFEQLLAEAHNRDLRIIMDLVLNHTSEQHPWFLEALKGVDNEYRDYYLWRDPKAGGGPPNNWGSVFGGSAWEMDQDSGQYYLHLFYKGQPDLNWRNPKVHQAMLDVFRFWCDKGVDGFRLDVFNLYYKHPQLPDNPWRLIPTPPYGRKFDWQHHIYDYNQPEMMPLLAEIRDLLDSYPGRYAVGETFGEDPASAARYSSPGYLHAAFNFEFTNNSWDTRRFLEIINCWEALNSDGGWPTYVLGNHDFPRPGTKYGRGENDDLLKVAAAMLLTLRGTPYIYFGDEIGMRNIPIKRKEDVLDPIGRQYWPFNKGRDGCRSPMQWDSSSNAGFSSGLPWLPVHDNHPQRNVENQLQNPDSLLNFYRLLLRTRKEHIALRQGSFLPLSNQPNQVLAYQRIAEDEALLIALNFADQPRVLDLAELQDRGWGLLLSSSRQEPPPINRGKLRLLADEVLILKKAN
ncbi:MAG: alpha-glucosidase [Anaerolineales bacterium]|jgi:alpha-glucosidase